MCLFNNFFLGGVWHFFMSQRYITLHVSIEQSMSFITNALPPGVANVQMLNLYCTRADITIGVLFSNTFLYYHINAYFRVHVRQANMFYKLSRVEMLYNKRDTSPVRNDGVSFVNLQKKKNK